MGSHMIAPVRAGGRSLCLYDFAVRDHCAADDRSGSAHADGDRILIGMNLMLLAVWLSVIHWILSG